MSEEHSATTARAVAIATSVAMVMIAQHVVGIITRDSLFLSNFPATDLPYVMAGSSVLSSLVVFSMARLMARLSPARGVPLMFAVSGLLFVVEWFVSQEAILVAAVMVFLHTAALGAAVISGFWSVMNESFDPHTAKQVFGRIGAGASLGGIIGGIAAWQGSDYLSLQTMLIILAVLNIGCGAGLLLMGKEEDSDSAKSTATAPSALKVIKELPYLRRLALLVVIGTIAEVTIGYVYKSQASDRFADSADLVSFFAMVHTSVSVLSFFLQSILAKRSLQRIGIAGTVAVHSGTVMLGSFLALLFPGLTTMTGLRSMSGSLRSSLFRSGYELFYTPLPKLKKRATKTFIDVGCSRSGGLVAAGLAMLAIGFIPSVANQALMGLALTCTLLCLVLISLLHSGYVEALAESLRSGSVHLRPDEVADATTLKTLADTMSAMNRDSLMAEIEAIRQRPTISSDEERATEVPDDLIHAITDLRSGDSSRIRAVAERIVSSGEGSPMLVAFLIPLLARTDLQRDVHKALSVLAKRSPGQIIDALLDPKENVIVRRRIPRVLAACPDQRVADGLVLGLQDKRFAVRYRCASALQRITADEPGIHLVREHIIAIAEDEAKVGKELWDAQSEPNPAASSIHSATESETTHKLGLSLEHIFNLLSLVLDRAPLLLAQKALASDDRGLRGTGLEYLENVVPRQVRTPLWPYLDDEGVSKQSGRKRTDIVKDLMNKSQVIAGK